MLIKFLDGTQKEFKKLYGADLSWANFSEASLSGANLSGVVILNHRLKRFITSCKRIVDPYDFFGFETIDNNILIIAGCRTMTIKEYREHTNSYYFNNKKEATKDCLDFIEASFNLTK